MARRINTNYRGNCCEWCDDLFQGTDTQNLPPQGCADWMCSDPSICSGKGYGGLIQVSSAPGMTTGTTGTWETFDGRQVAKNWTPLVVLGLSLIIGIGITEWATKKYIK